MTTQWGVRPEMRHLRDAALEVEELLHAAVGAEAALGDDVVGELEGDAVGDDGGVALRDVGEGACVDECGAVLEGLHEVGLDGVHHEDGHGACDAEVLGGDGSALLGCADDDASEALAEVLEVGAQGEGGHDLGGDGDVEAGLARAAVGGGAEADDDVADRAVGDVNDAVPDDRVGVDVEPLEAAAGEALVAEGVLVEDAGVDGGGEEVVGRADRVDVAGEVEVEVLHGHDLGVSAARGAALDAEGGALGGLADAGEDVLADVVECLAQADGRDGLALAEGGGGDGGDVDVLAVGLFGEAVEDGELYLGLDVAIELELVALNAGGLGDLDDRLEGGCLSDIQIRRHRHLL